MFTRDFRRLRALLALFACAGALYVCVSASLLALARWTEARYTTYPWKEEDHLRVLLDTLFVGKGQDRILIMGPSEARSAVLHDRLEHAFSPMRVFQGAQSAGTLSDALLALEYMEEVQGVDSIPRVVILGITPRFVANIHHKGSPLQAAINRYSDYEVLGTKSEPILRRKSATEVVKSRLRFLVKKQPGRNLTAVAVLLKRCLLPVAPGSAAVRFLRAVGSPYRYHGRQPVPRELVTQRLRDPALFWAMTHEWDPASEAARIRRDFARLRGFARQHRIRLWVVNLPEHPWNRARYRPGRYERYLQLVRQALGDTPVLDLRALLTIDEFYDAGHATLPGARRATESLIQFMEHGLIARGKAVGAP